MTMLPFGEVLERLPVPNFEEPGCAGAPRRHHLSHDRGSTIERGDRGDLLSMLLAAQDEDDSGG